MQNSQINIFDEAVLKYYYLNNNTKRDNNE